MNRKSLQTAALSAGLIATPLIAGAQTPDAKQIEASRVWYRTVQVDGLKIFYREAGPKGAPTVVLLHGFPSSSHMFRELIPRLSDKYHVLAPDYPGFGYSDAPSPDQYAYTFDHLADTVDHFLDQQGVTKYSIYIQDYGAPVGFRLATRHPDRVQAIITQNGNAYDEGLAPFWAEYLYPYWKDPNVANEAKVRQLLTLDATRLQYLQGFRNPEHVNPDSYLFDQAHLTAPATTRFSWPCFMTTATTRLSIPPGISICARRNPPCS
jgi:pimeloyl-ACP methyl ester carboxylesterase